MKSKVLDPAAFDTSCASPQVLHHARCALQVLWQCVQSPVALYCSLHGLIAWLVSVQLCCHAACTAALTLNTAMLSHHLTA